MNFQTFKIIDKQAMTHGRIAIVEKFDKKVGKLEVNFSNGFVGW